MGAPSIPPRAPLSVRQIAAQQFAQNTSHQFFIEGDSKAQVGGGSGATGYVMWALARYPADIIYDYATANLAIYGGTSDGTNVTQGNDAYGGTKNSGMLTAQRLARCYAQIALGCDMAILQVGTNDLATVTDDVTIIGNVLKWHNLMRGAGLKRLILMSLDPRAGSSATVQGINASHNRALAEYARRNADVTFIDTSGITLIADASGYLPASGVMVDGVHETAATNYKKAGLLGPVLQQLAPPKSMRTLVPELYNATSARWASIPPASGGANGRFAGTGGTRTTVNSTGSASTGWEFMGGDAGLTTTVTGDVACTYLNNLYGRSDFLAKRITVSGTPGANTYVGGRFLSGTTFSNFTAGVDTVGHAFAVQCNSLVGCWGIGTYLQANTGAISAWGKAGNYLSTSVLPTLDGFYHVERPSPTLLPAGITSLNAWWELYFAAGVPVSGSFDLISFNLRKISTPAAAA